MLEFLAGIALALAGGLAITVYLLLRRGKSGAGREVRVYTSIDEIRSVGELSVFKVVTKEIVTAFDHWGGAWGKKYLQWLWSSKKMAMIFEFDIDFRYDLRAEAFRIAPREGGSYTLQMPPCRYEIYIRDISFYDEQRGKLLPWLLPDLLTAVFGDRFNEEDKNGLKEEAMQKARELAQGLVDRLRGEVQGSARETMQTLARGFGATNVTVDFQDEAPQAAGVEFETEHAAGD